MCQKEKRDDRISLNKAAIKHKLDLLEGRLNYWKEFHRKLQREERKAFQDIVIIEEIKPKYSQEYFVILSSVEKFCKIRQNFEQFKGCEKQFQAQCSTIRT